MERKFGRRFSRSGWTSRGTTGLLLLAAGVLGGEAQADIVNLPDPNTATANGSGVDEVRTSSTSGNLRNYADVNNFATGTFTGNLTNGYNPGEDIYGSFNGIGTLSVGGNVSNLFGETDENGYFVGNQIVGTGVAGSTFSVGGNMSNEGVIRGFHTIIVGGDATSTLDSFIPEIVGTGFEGSSFKVTGGSEIGYLSGFESVEIGSTVRGGFYTGLGNTESTFTALEDYQANSLKDYNVVQIGGDALVTPTLSSESQGMTGLGADSTLTIGGKLTNSSQISQYGQIAVTGDVENGIDVFGNETGFGTIAGTGEEATLEIGGSLNNHEGTTVANLGTMDIGGDLTNAGALGSRVEEPVGAGGKRSDIRLATNLSTGATTVGGDFTSTSTASYAMNVTDDGEGMDRISVTGAASVDGGTLNIGGDDMKIGKEYVFISGEEGLTVSNELSLENPEDVAPVIYHVELAHDATEYTASLRRDFVYAGAVAGQTATQNGIGRYLDEVAYTITPDSEMYTLLAGLDNLSDPGLNTVFATQQKASLESILALDQLAGNIYPAMGMVAMRNQYVIDQKLMNQVRPLTCTTCNDADKLVNVWIQYYYFGDEADSSGNTFGYDSSTSGGILGADLQLNSMVRVGAWGSMGGTSMDMDRLSEKANIDHYSGGLYAVSRDSLGYFAGDIGAGYDQYDTTRHVQIGQFDRSLTADVDGSMFMVHVERGFDFCFQAGNSWTQKIQPFIGYRNGRVSVDDYNEGDRPGAIRGGGYDISSNRTEFGARYVLLRQDGQVNASNLYLQGAWVHEYSDTNATAWQSLGTSAQGFSVASVDLGSNWANAGVGANWAIAPSLVLNGAYDVMANGDETIHQANAGAMLRW